MITRRDATALLGAMGLGATTFPWARDANAATHVLPEDPVEQNEVWVRIAGRTDEGESIWRVHIRFYAITNDGVIPLLQTRGAMRDWWRAEGNSVHHRYVSTTNFYVDPESGVYIDEFTNPITGRLTQLEPLTGRRKHGEVFTPNGRYHPETREAFPEMYEDRPLALDWRVEAGLVRVFDTVHFPPIVLQPMHEVHTYAAPAAQALDETLNSAEAITTGWFAAAFRPWMDMADVDGYLLWHVEKTKLAGLGDLDDAFLAHARAIVKNFDVSPEFDEGPSYLEMRMREQGGADG